MRFTGTFIIVVTVFVAVLITSNIIAVKPIELINLPFEFIGSSSVVIPASIIIFPISYIVGDILTEVYGFRIARGVIWLGFGANLLVVIALCSADSFPPPVSGEIRKPTTPSSARCPGFSWHPSSPTS